MDDKLDVIATAEAIGTALGLSLPMIEVMDFRKGGYLPEALLNYLALLGWSPKQEPGQPERELFGLAELIERWDVGRVGKTASKFDPEKLKWMNGEYLRTLPLEVLEARMLAWAQVVHSELMELDPAFRARVIHLYRPRAQTFVELEAAARWMWAPPTRYDEKAVQKWVFKAGATPLLRAARGALAECVWAEADLEACLEGVVAAEGAKIGAVAQPIRIALSGAAATPGLYETLVALDKADVLRRLDRALSMWEAP
jgi:glutamyl/glutaminyl-tRNA synthetase